MSQQPKIKTVRIFSRDRENFYRSMDGSCNEFGETCLQIGDRKTRMSIDEIGSKLAGRMEDGVRVEVFMHGNADAQGHYGDVRTARLLERADSLVATPVHFLVNACFAKAAQANLKPGSTLITVGGYGSISSSVSTRGLEGLSPEESFLELTTRTTEEISYFRSLSSGGNITYTYTPFCNRVAAHNATIYDLVMGAQLEFLRVLTKHGVPAPAHTRELSNEEGNELIEEQIAHIIPGAGECHKLNRDNKHVNTQIFTKFLDYGSDLTHLFEAGMNPNHCLPFLKKVVEDSQNWYDPHLFIDTMATMAVLIDHVNLPLDNAHTNYLLLRYTIFAGLDSSVMLLLGVGLGGLSNDHEGRYSLLDTAIRTLKFDTVMALIDSGARFASPGTHETMSFLKKLNNTCETEGHHCALYEELLCSDALQSVWLPDEYQCRSTENSEEISNASQMAVPGSIDGEGPDFAM